MADVYLADVDAGLNTMVASARKFLAENLTSQNYSETDVIDNPQSISGSILSVTPQLVAIQTFIGKRVSARLSAKAFATFGTLAQDANERKKNTDGHALFATATTTLGSSGTTFTYSNADAGTRRIKSDATEPGADPIAIVLHGYHVHDIRAELISGVGTYPIPEGMTAEIFKNGFMGMLGGANVYEDGLIAVDGTPDARGAVFSKQAILLVQGLSPWRETKDRPEKGYGGMDVWLKDEYLYAERSPGNWLYGLLGDATAPT